MTKQYRIEKDSMGVLKVPANACYGAQTQRAVNNFPVSGLVLPKSLIQALAFLKHACATVNEKKGKLDSKLANAIRQVADEIIAGQYHDQFPVDIFQTGSGTSSNMNMNEVIAHIASQQSGLKVHPNDHVNMGQSSNDVFPSAIHVAVVLQVEEHLIPSLQHLQSVIHDKMQQVKGIVKTGRTHLMDAMPITMDQELSGWLDQLVHCELELNSALANANHLTLVGTAVGTGINTDADFGPLVCEQLSQKTNVQFISMGNYFAGLSAQNANLQMSSATKQLACSLMKIANDLRWMNSGPLAGLGEIALPALQPGSSIMPGKVNPVIPESVTMVAAQIIGNDSTITIGAQSGNFELNVMLPVIAYNLLQSIQLAANACTILADKAIAGFSVNKEKLNEVLDRNPILVTALNEVIGYEKGAAIAKKAYKEGRKVLDVALQETDLDEATLKRYLDPFVLTKSKK